jgi:hypothetical protein
LIATAFILDISALIDLAAASSNSGGDHRRSGFSVALKLAGDESP